MATAAGKKLFYLKFRIKGIGTFERYRWYVSRDSFVKATAVEFERKYPRLRIYVDVLDFKETTLSETPIAN
ncbi:MAG: hypothetical protein ABIG29_02795 [Candidatus Nealsonbacteria bacterium]